MDSVDDALTQVSEKARGSLDGAHLETYGWSWALALSNLLVLQARGQIDSLHLVKVACAFCSAQHFVFFYRQRGCKGW